jgi:broad specificity phosphatase PhoE
VSVVLLVRHGQASWASSDYDRLSPLGQEQSRVLGAALADRGLRPDLLVCGSMRRHRETAAAAVAGAGWEGEVVEDAGWDEFDHLRTLAGRLDFPEVPGEPYDERVRRVEAIIERWASGRHDEEYSESFPVFRDRVTDAFRRTVERLEPRQTAVVFTSGGAVSWVTASLTDGGVPAWSRLSKVMMNGSVTKVLDGRRGTSLISFNDHSHLEAAGPGLLSYR